MEEFWEKKEKIDTIPSKYLNAGAAKRRSLFG